MRPAPCVRFSSDSAISTTCTRLALHYAVRPRTRYPCAQTAGLLHPSVCRGWANGAAAAYTAALHRDFRAVRCLRALDHPPSTSSIRLKSPCLIIGAVLPTLAVAEVASSRGSTSRIPRKTLKRVSWQAGKTKISSFSCIKE